MKTVLAIVDPQTMPHLLLRSLTDHYALTVCTTAEEGAAALLRRPDALILDLFLPGCDTLKFLEDHAHALPPVVIGLSFVFSRSVVETTAQHGVDCLIRMPCTGREIARQLDNLLHKKDPSLSGGEGLSENCSV